MRPLVAEPTPTPTPTPMPGSALADVVRRSAAAAPLTHGVAVEQRGDLIAEQYFTADDRPSGIWIARTVAFDAVALRDMRSITKSVVGLLAGVAHGRGQLDVERPVLDWFPEHAALATPERRAIRLEHLLTMTAGFEWDESSLSYVDPFNSETRMGRRTIRRPSCSPARWSRRRAPASPTAAA